MCVRENLDSLKRNGLAFGPMDSRNDDDTTTTTTTSQCHHDQAAFIFLSKKEMMSLFAGAFSLHMCI